MNSLMDFLSAVDLCGCLSSDSSKAKKSYLVLTCGTSSVASLPKGKGENGEMCSSDDDDDGDESNDDQTVSSVLTRYVSCLYILSLIAFNLCVLSTASFHLDQWNYM